MGNRKDSKLVQKALCMVIQRRKAAKGTLVHSDQGSTYASGEYQRQLKKHHFVCSMSRSCKGE